METGGSEMNDRRGKDHSGLAEPGAVAGSHVKSGSQFSVTPVLGHWSPLPSTWTFIHMVHMPA